MVNYQHGKIYSLRSYQTDKIYVGSTARKLCARMGQHRYDYKTGVDISAKELMQYDDCYIELLEEYPCENKLQLKRREGQIQRQITCVNKNIAGRTKKEYYEDNKELILEKNKNRYEDKKEDILKYHKEYFQKNKELISTKRKEYYKENKEDIKAYKRQFYQDNKEEINKKSKEKVTCECGSIVRKSGIAEHRKTKKHNKLMCSIKE